MAGSVWNMKEGAETTRKRQTERQTEGRQKGRHRGDRGDIKVDRGGRGLREEGGGARKERGRRTSGNGREEGECEGRVRVASQRYKDLLNKNSYVMSTCLAKVASRQALRISQDRADMRVVVEMSTDM